MAQTGQVKGALDLLRMMWQCARGEKELCRRLSRLAGRLHWWLLGVGRCGSVCVGAREVQAGQLTLGLEHDVKTCRRSRQDLWGNMDFLARSSDPGGSGQPTFPERKSSRRSPLAMTRGRCRRIFLGNESRVNDLGVDYADYSLTHESRLDSFHTRLGLSL